jgi:hypothetical protein
MRQQGLPPLRALPVTNAREIRRAQRNAREQYENERRRFDSGLSTGLPRARTPGDARHGAGERVARPRRPQSSHRLFNRAVGGTFERHGINMPKLVFASFRHLWPSYGKVTGNPMIEKPAFGV